ncbi:MAG: radical SAM protein [Deltaproteobacteria bacterium]|nr:radical SAM protein [Deltaproteobacteria bacterium]
MQKKRFKISKYDLLKGYFFLFGFPKDGFVSIDVTNKCNLRCKHCYFFEQDVEEHELKADEWYEKLLEMKRKKTIPFLQCTWVGGEPLLRKDLIEKGRKLFKYNTIVTNGSFPIPDWKDNVNFYISIDGDEERHDLVRNKQGLYQKIKKTITESPVPVTVAFCINNLNHHSVEKCFHEWRNHPNVKNFCFDFYTPIETLSDDLAMSWELRDSLVDRLSRLKEQYPDFLAIDLEVLELMRSDRCRKVTDDCVFARQASAFDPSGIRKAKCMLGDKADCDRCGCVVPFYMYSLTHKPTVIKNTLRKWFVKPFRKKAPLKEPVYP